MSKNSDDQTIEFNCFGCGAPFVIKHKLPASLMYPLRATCAHCGNEHFLPRPGAILYYEERQRSTMTIKLPKDYRNTFCGLTFLCPICGGRDCVWRRLRRQGKMWIDEHYCIHTGQSIQADDLLTALKEACDDPLPVFVEFTLPDTGEGETKEA